MLGWDIKHCLLNMHTPDRALQMLYVFSLLFFVIEMCSLYVDFSSSFGPACLHFSARMTSEKSRPELYHGLGVLGVHQASMRANPEQLKICRSG